MSPNILICGFLGGFLVSVIPYIEKLNNIQPEDTKNSKAPISNWKYIQKTFNIYGLIYCVIYGLFGMALVWLIEPKESIYAIYLGVTAYPTVTKINAAFHPQNNHK